MHFWVATFGVVLYISSMWIAGVMQGLMWRATNTDATLTYAFVESVKATYPYYSIRVLGGWKRREGRLVVPHRPGSIQETVPPKDERGVRMLLEAVKVRLKGMREEHASTHPTRPYDNGRRKSAWQTWLLGHRSERGR